MTRVEGLASLQLSLPHFLYALSTTSTKTHFQIVTKVSDHVPFIYTAFSRMATPSYSAEPGPDERRLGIVAIQSANAPTGSFGTLIQRGKGVDIALKNQHEDAGRATYGRNASVAGEISLSSTQGITAVSVHVRQLRHSMQDSTNSALSW